MAKITVSIKGMDKAIQGLKNRSKAVVNEVDVALNESANIIANNAVRDAPKDESRLTQSISATKQGRLSYKVVADVFYAPYIEWGTKTKIRVPSEQQAIAAQYKGKAGRGTYEQFLERIAKWVKRKGIGATYNVQTRRKNRQTKDEKAQIVRAIAASIMKYGTAPQPFFWHNVLKEKPRLIDRIQKIVK
jgi:HK97 gp10 family phage protein